MTPNPSPLVRTVDDMLRDAGETDPTLRAALLSLGSFAAVPVPEPRADLASLLSGTTQLSRHRLRRRHRTAAVGLAVAAGMGLGVTGVAATGAGPSLSASPSVQHLLQDWSPSWSIMGDSAAQGAADRATEESAVETSPRGGVPAGQRTPDAAGADSAPGRAGTPDADDAARRAGAGQGPADRAAASQGKPAADGGAAGKAAGATPGGAASQDGSAGEKPKGASAAGADQDRTDQAGDPAKAGRLVGEAPAAVNNLVAGLLAPVLDEKTGASDAGPGSMWLSKFTR